MCTFKIFVRSTYLCFICKNINVLINNYFFIYLRIGRLLPRIALPLLINRKLASKTYLRRNFSMQNSISFNKRI